MEHSHIPLQPRKLSFNEKDQLVDKLLDCPKMRDRHTRDMIVQELSFAGSIPQHQVDRDEVWDIVNTSLNYEGSLQELVDVIATFEKDELGRNSLPMQGLNEFLKVLFSSPLEEQNLQPDQFKAQSISFEQFDVFVSYSEIDAAWVEKIDR